LDVPQIKMVLQNVDLHKALSNEGKNWSRNFTTNSFEREIKKLLTKPN